MNTLEKYLIKEGILEQFLGNLDFFDKTSVSIITAFDWINTPEGEIFWMYHYNQSNFAHIKVSRIEELLQERIPRFRKE